MNMPDQFSDEWNIKFILLFKSKNFISQLIVTSKIAIIPVAEETTESLCVHCKYVAIVISLIFALAAIETRLKMLFTQSKTEFLQQNYSLDNS